MADLKPLFAAVLFVFLAPQACRTVKGPVTKDCPKGIYVVFEDKDKTPPELSYVCKDPAPEPSPTPVPSPTPTPEPSPSPSPSPEPSPSPRPSPTPSPERGPEWDDPDHVTIGENPHNQFCGAGGNRIYVFNTTPRDADGRPCKPSDRGCMYSRPEIRAWGPGFNGDEVVRSSRTAEPWEPACPPDDLRCYKNYYLPRMVIGPDGSPAGHYTLRAAPRGQSVTGSKARAREYDLRDCR